MCGLQAKGQTGQSSSRATEDIIFVSRTTHAE